MQPNRVVASDGRGVSPVIGTVVLIALTICLVAAVAVGLGSMASTPAPTHTAAFDLSANEADQSVAIRHVAGDSIDVRELSVRVTVGGTSLKHQPSVPFFSEVGFDGGPTGPFNERADSTWSAGETAEFRLARTNEPSIDAGDQVVVTLVIEGRTIGRVETTAA